MTASSVLDSSAWLEFLTNGPRAGVVAELLRDVENVVTPAVVLYEVYKKLRRERPELAVIVLAQMSRSKVVTLDRDLAVAAAELSLAHSLAMADAIIYATSRMLRAKLVTADAHFEGLEGVVFLPKIPLTEE